MSNRELGNKLEQRIAEILSAKGFWVHLLTQNQAGQPADIICVKNNKAALIDAKVCSHGYFDTNRIESNQTASMHVWADCGNREWWFALGMPDGEIYMIPGDVAQHWVLKHTSPAIYYYECNRHFMTLEGWCEREC